MIYISSSFRLCRQLLRLQVHIVYKKTTIPKPNGYESTKQLVAYETVRQNNLGRYL